MTLHYQTNIQPAEGRTLIIPIEQGEHCSRQLLRVAELTQHPLAFLERSFKAQSKQVLPLPYADGHVVLLGLGRNVNFASTLMAFQWLGSKHYDLLGEAATLYWPYDESVDAPIDLLSEAAVNGLWRGSYLLGRYKTDEKTAHALRDGQFALHLVVPEGQMANAQAYCQRGLIVAQAQTSIMALVNAPANHKHPQQLAQWATDSAKQYGYQATIMDKAQIEAAGMGGLLAVNRGSEEPPYFILLEYRGPKNGTHQPRVGLVGKGVTFDTGGLSIKPSANMHYMKSDMGGAAAVLGTVEAAARLQLPVHLVAAVPTTDNSVDAKAIKPSDVIKSYSGKTIEIIDTDAEGRLILADGLSYLVRQHEPQVIIDLATLTGAAVRALGYEAAALFSNDDQLAHHLEQAGTQTGEKVWRFPLWDAYGEEMKSDVADIKNLGTRPVAGAITAAKFLQFFTDDHPSWAHLDIAGAAFGDTPFGKGKAATGYGVRLLVQFLMSIA